MEITIKGDYGSSNTTIKMGRDYNAEIHRKGGMICKVSPWGASGCPITLDICICPDGTILKRSWNWDGSLNPYLHTHSELEDIEVTNAMRDTVSGLFSGRILVDGVKIGVGVSVQNICPIDVEKEEQLTGNKIYCAY